jgi:hypothetical protein
MMKIAMGESTHTPTLSTIGIDPGQVNEMQGL